MKAVAHVAPVASLEALNVEGPAEDKEAEYYYTQKPEVNPPQYVLFYIHRMNDYPGFSRAVLVVC